MIEYCSIFFPHQDGARNRSVRVLLRGYLPRNGGTGLPARHVCLMKSKYIVLTFWLLFLRVWALLGASVNCHHIPVPRFSGIQHFGRVVNNAARQAEAESGTDQTDGTEQIKKERATACYLLWRARQTTTYNWRRHLSISCLISLHAHATLTVRPVKEQRNE